VTDITFFGTRWAFFSSVFVESNSTVTDWSFVSGVVGTFVTDIIRRTGQTLWSTRDTFISIEIFSIWTWALWSINSSLSTNDTTINIVLNVLLNAPLVKKMLIVVSFVLKEELMLHNAHVQMENISMEINVSLVLHNV
jgi:hypothetical protein